MKITLLQSNLARALGQVSRIVGTRTTLPVLSNILISSKGGKIKFSATDLEVGISTFAIGKIDEEGELTLPARMLSDFVLNNKDESIEIKTKATIATLKSKHYEANIHGISAEEFPTVPAQPDKYFATIPKDVFVDALKKVNISSAVDETRPVLGGIYFVFDGDKLTLAATDSYRLSEKKITLSEKVLEKKIIVPSKTMNEILRLLSNSSDEIISLSADENQITFKIGDAYVVSRLIEGSFPNYQAIIPAKFGIEITVSSIDLLSAVKMSALFAKDSANNNVKFAIKAGKVTLSSVAAETGSAVSEVSAETTGGDVEIAFNARYVLDILSVIGDKNIKISLNDSSSPGMITAKNDADYLYIIMPLKLDN